MPKFTGSLVTYPARVSFLWYSVAIGVGATLLVQPFCRASGRAPIGMLGRAPIGMLEALFTATSATCVTGLTVRSTANDFSLLGQVVLLLMIQLGGIGIMTVTTFLTFRLSGRASLRHRAVITETLGSDSDADLKRCSK